MFHRILVTGANGQLAGDLIPALYDHSATASAEMCLLAKADLDVTDASAVRQRIDDLQPDLIINTAAYNLVDRAEEEPDIAWRLNSLAPRTLAQVASARNTRFVHISTDQVFGIEDSRTAPYEETDPPGPVNVYGTTKLAGEHLVRSAGGSSLIIRTCGLYGAKATQSKGNFVETIRRVARMRRELRVVDDQVCTPSWTVDVARGIVALIAGLFEGTVHLTNRGETSWYNLAREIVTLEGLPAQVLPTSSAEYGSPARRPRYSVLSGERFERLTGMQLPTWRAALCQYLQAHPYADEPEEPR